MDPSRVPWRIRVVVGLEILVDVGMLVWVIVSGQKFLAPGAIGRLLIMGTLGAYTLAGRTWARWCFAGPLALTAIAAIVFGLYSFTGGAHLALRPATLAAGALYSVALVGIIYPVKA